LYFKKEDDPRALRWKVVRQLRVYLRERAVQSLKKVHQCDRVGVPGQGKGGKQKKWKAIDKK